MTKYHSPVMLKECMDGLNINPSGTYVDVTFGGGGHSKEILKHLKDGRLFAFDQDEDAIANTIDDERFTLIESNFSFIKNFLRYHDAIPVDGILADLGISSHQIDVPERGFAHRYDAELDMRMDQGSELSAKTVINEYDEQALAKIFWQYGEVKNSRKLAQTICTERTKAPIETVFQLRTVISSCIPKKIENRYLSQVFQALRIEVNRELETLKTFLEKSAEVMEPGGRLVVMSYHSLEDRLVKNFINSGNFDGKAEKDIYGNTDTPFKAITRKPITATDEEIAQNPRARSAKLRIAERI